MIRPALQRIIIVSALCSVSSHGERRYHFVYEQKTPADALKHCRETYTDLVSIHNMQDVRILEEMADLKKMVFLDNSYAAWIGLYDDVNGWRWSLEDQSFYKDGEAEFRNWRNGEPNNYDPGEHCVRMHAGGYWSDFLCEGRFPAVCFDARGPNGTFVLINTPMSWSQAQSACRVQYTDLASVRNEAENQRINEVALNQRVWIGLFRETWKWTDGSNSSFRFWNPGEPDRLSKEICVIADFAEMGRWENWNCDETAVFICYSRVTPVHQNVITVRLVRKDSSLDLNDPVVMEDLLKQFKQRLDDEGVSGDIRLSWKEQWDGNVFHKDEKRTTNHQL